MSYRSNSDVFHDNPNRWERESFHALFCYFCPCVPTDTAEIVYICMHKRIGKLTAWLA